MDIYNTKMKPKLSSDTDTDTDPINPMHYKQNGIETIDIIRSLGSSVFEGFCIGNIIKYITRAGRKEGNTKAQDLLKAQWYLNTLVADILKGE